MSPKTIRQIFKTFTCSTINIHPGVSFCHWKFFSHIRQNFQRMPLQSFIISTSVLKNIIRNYENNISASIFMQFWRKLYWWRFKRTNVLPHMEWPTSISPRPKKTRVSRLRIKTLLICFFFRFLENRSLRVCASRPTHLPRGSWKISKKIKYQEQLSVTS